MIPHFSHPLSISVPRYGSDEIFQMVAVADMDFSQQDYETITTYCNEPLIYNFLFQRRLAGRKYEISDSQRFVSWAQKGWQENAYFVFLIKNPSGKIVGAIDIKSADVESAEIGYWASDTTHGFMTNSVIALCKLAKTAGYTSLYALVDPKNSASKNVLIRSGFNNLEEIEKEGRSLLKLSKDLS